MHEQSTNIKRVGVTALSLVSSDNILANSHSSDTMQKGKKRKRVVCFVRNGQKQLINDGNTKVRDHHLQTRKCQDNLDNLIMMVLSHVVIHGKGEAACLCWVHSELS